jgi:hypothetical protein
LIATIVTITGTVNMANKIRIIGRSRHFLTKRHFPRLHCTWRQQNRAGFARGPPVLVIHSWLNNPLPCDLRSRQAKRRSGSCIGEIIPCGSTDPAKMCSHIVAARTAKTQWGWERSPNFATNQKYIYMFVRVCHGHVIL